MEVEIHQHNPINTIDFITIATTGNAQDFGDLTTARGMEAHHHQLEEYLGWRYQSRDSFG